MFNLNLKLELFWSNYSVVQEVTNTFAFLP